MAKETIPETMTQREVAEEAAKRLSPNVTLPAGESEPKSGEEKKDNG